MRKCTALFFILTIIYICFSPQVAYSICIYTNPYVGTLCAPDRRPVYRPPRRPAYVPPRAIARPTLTRPEPIQSRPAMSAPLARPNVSTRQLPLGPGAPQQTNYTAPREYPPLTPVAHPTEYHPISPPPTYSIGAMPHPTSATGLPMTGPCYLFNGPSSSGLTTPGRSGDTRAPAAGSIMDGCAADDFCRSFSTGRDFGSHQALSHL